MSTETPKAQKWIADWKNARQELEALIESHAERDPGLHFEVTLANLELREIDEAVHRLEALCRVLCGSDLITSSELEGTGNTSGSTAFM